MKILPNFVRINSKPLCITVFSIIWTLSAIGQDTDADELAKKLANPVASLISVPIQVNYDEGIGPNDDGSVLQINIQPVIPISLNDDWNVISRTIIPIIDQDDVPGPGMGESGVGDIVQSFFFSPKDPTDSGWILGAGPVMLLPTGTEDALSTEKWGLGPTGVALKQVGPITYGVLANHIWSVAGDDDRSGISSTLLQPFASYVTKTKTTWAISTESSYNWNAGEWSVPVNLNVSQMLKLGNQIMQIGAGVRYWLDSVPGGPEGWGFRFQVTLLYPQ